MIEPLIPTYWHRSVNFGDCIAPYLIKKMTGMHACFVANTEQTEHIGLIGSLLDGGPLNNTHVWGCGFAYADSPVYPPKEIYAVRGMLSRQKYLEAEIDCPEVYGDPALLLPLFFDPVVEKAYKLGVIPHVADFADVVWNYANKYEDVLIIDLSKPVETVIEQILSCEKTISSSLHGIIVSHAYGIPSRWVEFSDRVLGAGFKFRDYYTTMDFEDYPEDLRNFPDIHNIEIPIRTIEIDLELLLNNFPL